MSKQKQDDIQPEQSFQAGAHAEYSSNAPMDGALEPAHSPDGWRHPYRSCAPKDRELYILQALLAGGGFLIPSEEAPPRTAERLVAITEEIVAQAKIKGWIEADPVAPAAK